MKAVLGREGLPTPTRGKKSKVMQSPAWEEMNTAILKGETRITPGEVLGYWIITDQDKKEYGKGFTRNLMLAARKRFEKDLKLPIDVYSYRGRDTSGHAVDTVVLAGSMPHGKQEVKEEKSTDMDFIRSLGGKRKRA